MKCLISKCEQPFMKGKKHDLGCGVSELGPNDWMGFGGLWGWRKSASGWTRRLLGEKKEAAYAPYQGGMSSDLKKTLALNEFSKKGVVGTVGICSALLTPPHGNNGPWRGTIWWGIIPPFSGEKSGKGSPFQVWTQKERTEAHSHVLKGGQYVIIIWGKSFWRGITLHYCNPLRRPRMPKTSAIPESWYAVSVGAGQCGGRAAVGKRGRKHVDIGNPQIQLLRLQTMGVMGLMIRPK